MFLIKDLIHIVRSFDLELLDSEARELILTNLEVQKAMIRVINSRFGKSNIPEDSDSIAISLDNPKTAALAFDKVYQFPGLQEKYQVPDEIGFYGATDVELRFGTILVLLSAYSSFFLPSADEQSGRESVLNDGNIKSFNDNTEAIYRAVTEELPRLIGRLPTYVFDSDTSCKRTLEGGSTEVLNTVIRNLSIVKEDKLTWEQVLEFRSDTESKIKYRRLVRWISKELNASSPTEVGDYLAIRLDDYNWAIKKHGLEATVGTISSLLDPKFVAGLSGVVAVGGLAGAELWTALTAGAITVGRASVSIGTQLTKKSFGIRESKDYEVAYVYDISKLGAE